MSSARPPGGIATGWSTSFNRDRPYDEFARLQLAGDVLRPTTPTRSRRPASWSPGPMTPSARTSSRW